MFPFVVADNVDADLPGAAPPKRGPFRGYAAGNVGAMRRTTDPTARRNPNVDDVEKRWRDPRELRSAVGYVAVVVLIAVVAFVWYATGSQYAVARAVATPAVLFVGAVGALVKTYRDWRVGRTWPIWQGAGWFLLSLALVTLSVPAMGIGG